MIAGRYRIVGLLGKGGMGEVYRADDLKLGQGVALKFLPPTLARDEGRLAQLHNEVRLARAVSHPNVCRVYDIGEVDGEHFISMEYVDGEDLASLLRRIGRLPPDKGVAIAQQLCAGLAAAHDRGVLHRDLKPANIMIDGRGHARITDFGLARLTDELNPRESAAGTPAYMAPEQLAGQRATVQSDLYALGLVLFELFTGKRRYSAVTRAELAQLQSDSAPPTPSSLVSDIDPAVERTILRCLERQPAQRPASALAVAAALPGGDPLAAALAAGQTPAPEMVAAAGERGGLDPRIGVACLAIIAAGLIAVAWLSDRVTLIGQDALPIKPEALEQKAREIITELGYPETEDSVADSAYGFEYDDAYLRYARERGLPISAQRLHGIFFWYRRSPRILTPQRIFETAAADLAHGRVGMNNPPHTVAGMVRVSLDSRGNLIEFIAVPPLVASHTPASAQPQWDRLFELANLDLMDFVEENPTRTPPVYVERRYAWRLSNSDAAPIDLRVARVDAATFDGRVAYFRAAGPWGAPRDAPSVYENLGVRLIGVLATSASLIAIGLAVHNMRLRRVDNRGAMRLAVFTFACVMLRWLVEASHRADADLMHERIQFVFASAIALYYAAVFWFVYLALEPYVRRLWPQTLISWSRVLAGRFRDPLVGRDVLIGATFGVAWVVLGRVTEWNGMASGAIPPAASLHALLGAGQVAGDLLQSIRIAIFLPFILLTTFMVLRILLRYPWLAAAVVWLIFTIFLVSAENAFALGWIPFGLIALSWVILITRFGLLAFVAGVFVQLTLVRFLTTTDLAAWYADGTLFAFAVVLALAAYGFYLSLAGQKIFGILGDAR